MATRENTPDDVIADATARAAACMSIEELADWMGGLVGDWMERDGRVFAVAAGALSLLDGVGEGENAPASLLHVIQDQVESTELAMCVDAGIERFKVLAAKSETSHE